VPRRYNGGPSQQLLVIRENHRTGERSLDLLTWGLIANWCLDPKGGRKPINAKAETITARPTFRHAYRLRRCIVPVDAFFEWQATRGGKQPYAIAMSMTHPLGSLDYGRTGEIPSLRNGSGPLPSSPFRATSWSAAFTTGCRRSSSATLMIAGSGKSRIPHDLLITYPSEPMRMWPVSKRVNKPENDDPAILEPVELDAA